MTKSFSMAGWRVACMAGNSEVINALAMAGYLDAHPELKYVFFGGKGGVGKTVMAGASAVWTAEKGKRTLLVARALERIGDNAVDIGEQVAFVVTGLFREFEDASHPGGVVEPQRSP